jgi:hypothetical protein
LSIPYDQVIPLVHVIRIDHIEPGGTVPRAAFVVAPVHGNSVDQENEVYHGDLFGTASRYMAAAVQKEYGLEEGFIAAVAPGPQGDVSPNYKEQGFNEADRIGEMISKSAFQVFKGLKGKLKPLKELKTAYTELQLQDPGVSGGILCDKPVVGAPIAGGTEDGRSFLFGELGVYEGNTQFPDGCHGVKKTFFGDVGLHDVIITHGLPDVAALQVVRLGDVITLATVPGEPTTETGRLIKVELEKIPGQENTAVVAIANEYMSYIATCREYQAQHFEGAFTMYGPNESMFIREQLVKLSNRVNGGGTPELLPYKERSFEPGSSRKIFSPQRKCRPAKWKAIKGKHTEPHYEAGVLKWLSFSWNGLRQGRLCGELPTVSIECNGKTVINSKGVKETDHWLNFEVRRKGRRTWKAVWTPPKGLDTGARYRVKVKQRDYDAFFSDYFTLTEPAR